MKSGEGLERVDFGGHPKYNGGSSYGTVLFPGRSTSFGTPKKNPSGSLFDLNPHRNALGLNLQDFAATKLCPRPSPAELHCDTPAAGAAPAEGTGLQAVAAAAAAVQGDPQPQQKNHEQEKAKADTAGDAEAGGSRKRQRLSPQATPTAAETAAADKPPSLDNLISVSADGGSSPSREGSDGFIVIGTSSSSSGGSSHDHSSSDGEGSSSDGPGSDSHEGKRRRQQRRSDGTTTAAAAAASGGGDVADGDGGQSGSGESMSISGASSDDEDELLAPHGDDEDSDDFIPLLDVPAQGGHGAAPQHQQQQQQRAAGYQPPWLPRLAHFSSPLLRLHNEIVAFCQMLAPSAEEVSSRAASLDTLRQVVRGIWPAANVAVFGSYETGLYTPASDTDVVVVDSGVANAQTGLKALAQALESRHLVRNMQLVLTARVPIIKFEMIDSGLAFDVSWEVPSGPLGAETVKQLLADWPALKPLALVLKVFLTQRELNEVYTGGVGSYTLIIMIVTFLQLHQSRRPGGHQQQQQQSSSRGNSNKRRRGSSGNADAQLLDSNLGLLLVDFMRLYGRVLNLNRVGITCNDNGSYFDRKQQGFPHVNRQRGGFTPPGQLSLCVEDPIDGTNDTARGSYNIRLVRQVFDHAYQLLNIPCPPNMSLLGRIIHLAPVVSGRPVPPWCMEAPTRQEQRRSQHHSSSSTPSRQQQQQQQRHSSGRDRERERGQRGRETGGRRSEDRRQSSHSRSRSRSKSSSRHHDGKHSSGGSGKHGSSKHERHNHHHHHHHSSSSGSKRGRRRSSEDNKGQQKIDKFLQSSPDGSSKGSKQQHKGKGSRASLGSDSGKEYSHRDKRRRY